MSSKLKETTLLSSSFGCCSLKSGAITIGYITLVQCCIGIPIFWNLEFPIGDDEGTSSSASQVYLAQATRFVTFVLGIPFFVLCCVFVFALHNNYLRAIEWWLVTFTVCTVFDLLHIVTCALLAEDFTRLCYLLRILVRIYFIAVVHSNYTVIYEVSKAIENSGRTARTEREERTVTIKQEMKEVEVAIKKTIEDTKVELAYEEEKITGETVV